MCVKASLPSPHLAWSSACRHWRAGGGCARAGERAAVACQGWVGCWGKVLHLSPATDGSAQCLGTRAGGWKGGCPPAAEWCAHLMTCKSFMRSVHRDREGGEGGRERQE